MVGLPVPTPHFFAWLPTSVFIIPCISFVFTDMISDFLKLIKTIFLKKKILIIFIRLHGVIILSFFRIQFLIAILQEET